MNGKSGLRLRWPAALGAAVLLIAMGALGSFVATRPSVPPLSERDTATTPSGDRRAPASASTDPSARAGDSSPGDLVVTLSEDAVKRARIVVASVGSGSSSGVLRLPAVVEPNAYKQIRVTPLVAGRVTRVLVELGAHVRQGQVMATVFSPELAEVQTRYISARAELQAHEQELARTEKLVQIGAASRQELERIHAEHTAQRSNVESARSRLELLGLSREAVEGLDADKPAAANAEVTAPMSGVVTERFANTGLNVDPSVGLFTVADLSTVWIVANLYEKDSSRVRVGDRVTVIMTAYPDQRLQGSVSYIDPQVSRETRTAKVRVEVSNARGEMRLGMLAEVRIEGSNQAAVMLIPRSAVQNVADRTVVYIRKPDAPGQFTERDVHLGQLSGEHVEVLSGVAPGEQVVTEGSFFLRAERERLGLRPLGSR